MANSREATGRNGQGETAPGLAFRRRPRLGLVDVLLHLWRAKWLMLLIFLPILGAGIFLSLNRPAKHVSSAQLIVSLDEAKLLRQQSVTAEDVMRIEISLFRSAETVNRVVRRFGLQRLYPAIAAEAESQQGAAPERIADRGIAALLDDFTVGAVPGERRIFAEFAHADPVLSTEVLNALMGAYLGYRSDVFEAENRSPYQKERVSLDAQLSELESEMSAFRTAHGISDFQSERASLQGFEASIAQDRAETDIQLTGLGASLADLETELQNTSVFLTVPSEDSATAQLADLEAERDDLLTRYLESSQTVKAVDKRLAELNRAAAREASEGIPSRELPNPAHADIAKQIENLEAQTEAARRHLLDLDAQIERIARRKSELLGLEPEWRDLQRRRSVLLEALKGLAATASRAEVRFAALIGHGDAVRVIVPAKLQRRDLTERLPVLLVFLLLGLIAAATAGLLRVLAQEGFATPRSLERSTGLPVVSAVPQQ
ncbi:MAG: hypothetical protein AAF950_04975 [Pseudomonadota bacterium]